MHLTPSMCYVQLFKTQVDCIMLDIAPSNSTQLRAIRTPTWNLKDPTGNACGFGGKVGQA